MIDPVGLGRKTNSNSLLENCMEFSAFDLRGLTGGKQRTSSAQVDHGAAQQDRREDFLCIVPALWKQTNSLFLFTGQVTGLTER